MQRETLEIWGRIGIGERVAQRGHPVAHRAHVPRHPRAVQRGAARQQRRALPAVREHQPDRGRGAPPRAGCRAGCGPALGPHAHRVDRWRGRRRPGAGHPGWTGNPPCPLPGRDRWRPFDGPPPAGRGLPGPQPRRPLPDLRHPRRAPVPERAALLLRPALEPGSPGPHPSAARRHLAHRLADLAGHRHRGRARRTAASTVGSGRWSGSRPTTSWCG